MNSQAQGVKQALGRARVTRPRSHSAPAINESAAKPLHGAVVVITGASSGIGRAAALAFAREGAHVVCAARGRAALTALTTQIIAQGGSARAVPTDVSDPASVATLVQSSLAAYGRIDVWINNAGVAAFGGVEDLLTDDYERLILVNYLGQVYGACAALPVLRQSAHPALAAPVLMGVVGKAGFAAGHTSAAYAASKFALRGFYQALQEELAAKDDPVAVVMVHPDAVASPLYRHARWRGHTQAQVPAQMYHPQVVAQAMVQAVLAPRRQVIIGGRAAAAIASGWAAPLARSAWANTRNSAVQWGLMQRLPAWMPQWAEQMVLTGTLPVREKSEQSEAASAHRSAGVLVRSIFGAPGQPASGPMVALGHSSAPGWSGVRDNLDRPSTGPAQISDELPSTVHTFSRYASFMAGRQRLWQWIGQQVRQWWDRPLIQGQGFRGQGFTGQASKGLVARRLGHLPR